MRVLITGAGGFVGGYLIQHLLEVAPDTEIIGVVHPGLVSTPPEDPRVRFSPCDITASAGDEIGRLVREVQPERLYHLAGAASGASVDREAVFHVNVEGTRHVIAAARGVLAPQHVLFAGTGYVYGPCDPARPAREEDPLPEPGCYGVYAASKQVAEDVVRESQGAVISRAFNHTGPGQTTAFSIPAFAAQIVQIERGQQTELHVGNLEALRDFLDVRDVVRAYRLLLEHAGGGETYNVCSGRAWRMQDILDQLRALARVSVTVQQDPARMRPSDIDVSVGDHCRLTSLTGWQPQIPLEQTLRETLDWWRGQ